MCSSARVVNLLITLHVQTLFLLNRYHKHADDCSSSANLFQLQHHQYCTFICPELSTLTNHHMQNLLLRINTFQQLYLYVCHCMGRMRLESVNEVGTSIPANLVSLTLLLHNVG